MRELGTGGFFLPEIYQKDQKRVVEQLKKGTIDYADLSQWSFADEFLCFILQLKFLEWAEKTYPNPRQKNEVPIWFLIATQFVLRLHNQKSYRHFKYLLNAGSILTKIGFNTQSAGSVGFNGKNKYERKTVVDQDTVRKFFKDTSAEELRAWFNEDIQKWMKAHKVYDNEGLFVLDQTHLVVPDNPHYVGATRMPVDEHGQRYKNLHELSAEQRKALIYHPCYALSYLLHLDPTKDFFHLSGYEFGSGKEDELVQAEKLVFHFCQKNPGVMKELILDRGYISGTFIGKLKQTYGVDVLLPLKKEMSNFEDALSIAERKNEWRTTELKHKPDGELLLHTETTLVEEMDLWETCPVKLCVYVSKTKRWSDTRQAYDEYTWALASTKKYSSEKAALSKYARRWDIEERFKQLKNNWQLARFNSPSPGLMEAQLCFISLTYNLLQLYLRRNDLRDLTHKTITTLRQEERLGKDVVIVYADGHFAILNLDNYTSIIIDMEGEPKQRLKIHMAKQKEERLKRETHSNSDY